MDLLSITAVVFIIIVFLVLGKTLITDFQNEGDFGVEANQVLVDTQDTLSVMDWFPLIIMFIMVIIGIISVSLIQTHPAYFVIGILLLYVAVLIAGQSSLILQDATNGTELETAYESLPVSKNMNEHFGTLIFIIGCLFLVFLYAKGGYMG